MCCGPYVFGELPAPDPESLMRSRYTAFALGTAEAVEYLVATHHPDHRPRELREGLRSSIAGIDAWEQLEVRFAKVDGDRGTVQFVATFRIGRERQELRERSEFAREDGRWFYTTGVVG
jgi:SEC-C motif domain protein